MTNDPRTASPAAIQKHYDVGREFYALWLDPTMSYSCATWHDGERDDALETAQLRKLDDHAREAGAVGVGRVLDVGCGWGALVTRLLGKHRVAHAVGLTLSRDQADFVRSLALPGAEIRLESWVDHSPAQPYDAIVSIGAFEHFARPGIDAAERHAIYRAFLERCRAWLAPGGGMSLQTIAYGNLGRGDVLPFMHDVFPESDLPRLSEIVLAAEGLFEVVRVRNDRADYSRTCYVWRQRLRARWEEAVALVGRETALLYDRYLMQSRFGFVSGATELLRVTLRRIDEPRFAP